VQICRDLLHLHSSWPKSGQRDWRPSFGQLFRALIAAGFGIGCVFFNYLQLTLTQ
jgi:hypothetical protein